MTNPLSMVCPHCKRGIFPDFQSKTYRSPTQPQDGVEVAHGFCPACKEVIVVLRRGDYRWFEEHAELANRNDETILFPQFPNRQTNPAIPQNYRRDFNEASAVICISPKASAALSRRLLQRLLREHYNIKPSNLDLEIQDFMKGQVPQYLVDAMDAIRVVGNFAAHPMEYKHTREIVDVDPDEAEFLVEVLDNLLEWSFVQPQSTEERINRLNQKLKKLGKPPMKQF